MRTEYGYAAILIIAAFLALAIARTSWKRNNSPGSKPLAALMLSLVWWSVTYALFWLRAPAPGTYFWLDATYFGVVAVPVTLLTFSLQFTNRGEWLARTRLFLLSLPQILTLIALWTDPQHGLFFGDHVRSPDVGNIFDGGIVFFTNLFYSYGLVALAIYLLVVAFFKSKGLYRQQLAAVLLGALIPLVLNAASVLGFNPIPELDLTPIAFTVTGVFFAFALYQLGLLDVVPVARYTLVDEMEDGVLVLDSQNRVVDLNPAAQKLMGLEDKSPIGKPAERVLARWPKILDRFHNVLAAREEVTFPGDPEVTIDLRITPLYASSRIFRGRLVILHDISAQVAIQNQLRKANEDLENQIVEVQKLQRQLREQAIRDPLTGLFNRRFLEESLQRELAAASRRESALSLAMLDIDRFKHFNDTYGHHAGDLMLQKLAEILLDNTRTSDIVCRYGGEEFIVVLPGADKDAALKRIQDCRRRFEEDVLDFEGKKLSSTLSAGIAGFPIDGDSVDALISAADMAMYKAKEQGRNKIVLID